MCLSVVFPHLSSWTVFNLVSQGQLISTAICNNKPLNHLSKAYLYYRVYLNMKEHANDYSSVINLSICSGFYFVMLKRMKLLKKNNNKASYQTANVNTTFNLPFWKIWSFITNALIIYLYLLEYLTVKCSRNEGIFKKWVDKAWNCLDSSCLQCNKEEDILIV